MEEIKVRRSHLNDFERCPRRFSYIKRGIKIRPQFQSLAIRQGSYLHSLISGIEEGIYFNENEQKDKMVVEIVVKVMKELELLPSDIKHEILYSNNGATGTLDLVSPDNRWFGEMKYTTKPDFYTNSFIAQAQLEWYFYLNPEFQYCYILPIRVPALRMQEVKESIEKFLSRLELDILKRPSFYFPKYSSERQEVKWGLKFYRHEFDMKQLEWRINFCIKLINYLNKIGHYPQHKANCLTPSECEYMSICETGAVSDTLYIQETQQAQETQQPQQTQVTQETQVTQVTQQTY